MRRVSQAIVPSAFTGLWLHAAGASCAPACATTAAFLSADVLDAIQAHVPRLPTPVNTVARGIPDEVMDELDQGLRDVFEAHKDRFALSIGSCGDILVRQKPRLAPRTAAMVREVLGGSQAGGLAISVALDRLDDEARADFAQLASPAIGLAESSSDFELDLSKGTVKLAAEAYATAKMGIVRRIAAVPAVFMPLAKVARECGMSATEFDAHLEKHQRLFDVATDPVGDLREAEYPDSDSPGIGTRYVRVHPNFAQRVGRKAAGRYAAEQVEDYDAFRLARFLTTDGFVPLRDLHDAAQCLSYPIFHVVISFPALFKYDAALFSVQYTVQPKYFPNAMVETPLEELVTRIDVMQERVSELGADKTALRINRKLWTKAHNTKMQLRKLLAARYVRAHPTGSVFMDHDVLAMLCFDALPLDKPVEVTELRTTYLPPHAFDAFFGLWNHHFLEKFPHLFYIYQVKPPEYLVQRADAPRPDEFALADDTPLEDLAKLVFDFAKRRNMQHSRPTPSGTLTIAMPLHLRRYIAERGLRYRQIAEAAVAAGMTFVRPAEHKFDEDAIEFFGPEAEASLRAPAYGEELLRKPVVDVTIDEPAVDDLPTPPPVPQPTPKQIRRQLRQQAREGVSSGDEDAVATDEAAPAASSRRQRRAPPVVMDDIEGLDDIPIIDEEPPAPVREWTGGRGWDAGN